MKEDTPPVLAQSDEPPAPLRWAAYRLAAGATTACFATEADGQIIWSTPQNLVVQQGYYQDLEINGDDPNYYYSDLIVRNYVFNNGNYQGITVRYAPGRLVGFRQNNLGYASALNPGDLIDETTVNQDVFAGSLAYDAQNPNAEFVDAPNGYIGFGFPIGGQIHYGWLRVAIDNAAGTFVVREWAFNGVAGEPILAGQVAGDYNQDGNVDAADYTVWRDTLGSTSDLRADGDADGEIAAPDLLVWNEDYGFSAFDPPGPSSATTVPEPITLGLLAAGAPGLGLLRRSRSPRNGGDATRR